jgi:hypothetical protein
LKVVPVHESQFLVPGLDSVPAGHLDIHFESLKKFGTGHTQSVTLVEPAGEEVFGDVQAVFVWLSEQKKFASHCLHASSLPAFNL